MDVQIARQLEEEIERDAQRMNEQITKDAEIARIHAEEELQIMIDGLDRNNETVAKYLQEYYQFAGYLPIRERIELISNLVKYQDNYAKVLKYQIQQRKPLSRKQQEFYMSVLKSHVEESERFKRKGIRLEHNSTTKVKTSEEVPKENLKEMMQLIPIKEVYVDALQVKHPIIDWEVHTKGQRSYWKIIRLGGSTTSYQFFVDLLKHFDREDLNILWALVKETLNTRQATSDKEKELWVELKRLYEPDVEDLPWNHTQNMMHALVEWKLYDTCEVHHVISKDQEMFMLVEKDYPLRKGLAIVMISYKLQIMIDGLDRNNETVAKYLQEYYQFAGYLPIRERIELISNLVKYQDNYAKVLKYQIQQRKPLSRKQQEFYMSVLKSHVGWKASHFKGMTLEEIKEKFDPV
uniref:Uncharacterized protein n=1 Tax=Tanacetum cinerariifolium TaxID=118510 RepID=A0A699JRU7_TANCI|nr:hypothetical protein [Tanacetum cinerariifolium]